MITNLSRCGLTLFTLLFTQSLVVGEDAPKYSVSAPPADLNLDPVYTKYVSASGYPIIASAKVNDFALKEAAYLVDMLLAKRPDVRKAMIVSGSRLIVMAHDEFTTDVPEHAHLKPKEYWDARARGLGGSQHDPVCSCGEENLLCFQGDPYSTENILIHEFAHNIHLRGMVNIDKTFDDRVNFAEGVQSWFDNNREPDHDHNHVNTRKELVDYDPALAALCKEVFGETELTYTRPTTRLKDHLEGYDPAKSPIFKWPERLDQSKAEIQEKARRRDEEANGK
jgi:hypothetical protein